MSEVETVRIRRLSSYVVINKADYNPEKHELWEPEPDLEKEVEISLELDGGLVAEVELEEDPDEPEEQSAYEIIEEMREKAAEVKGKDLQESELKLAIEQYARGIEIELDRRKNPTNMIADLEAAVNERSDMLENSEVE